MLIQILDELNIPKVIAIGQSWGAIVLVKTAYKYPDKFASLGLCNMPFTAVDEERRNLFAYAHSILNNRDKFLELACQVFLSKSNIVNQKYVNYLKKMLDNLTNDEIIRIDKSSSLLLDDLSVQIENLKIPALALIGKEDFAGISKNLETKIVGGGHLSPLEAEVDVLDFINKVTGIKV